MVRISCSSSTTRRGVNALDTSRRSTVCSGGSRKIIMPRVWASSVIISNTVLWAEL